MRGQAWYYEAFEIPGHCEQNPVNEIGLSVSKLMVQTIWQNQQGISSSHIKLTYLYGQQIN